MPKPPEGTAGRGVRQNSPRMDAGVGHPVRATAKIVALGHHPLGDVDISPDQIIGFNILELDQTVGGETCSHLNARGGTPDRLEGFLQSQHQSARASRSLRDVSYKRFKLRVLLPAEPPSRIRCNDVHSV